MKHLILFCFFVCTTFLSAQTIEEKYSLDFSDFSWILYGISINPYIDSTILINEKHPFKLTSIKEFPLKTHRDSSFFAHTKSLNKILNRPFCFKLGKDIILPDSNESLNIS